jgi:hypothetical protein
VAGHLSKSQRSVDIPSPLETEIYTAHVRTVGGREGAGKTTRRASFRARRATRGDVEVELRTK